LKPDVVPSIIIILLCVGSFLVSFGMPLHLALVKPPEGDLGVEVLDNLDKLMKDAPASELFLQFLKKRACDEVFHFYLEVEKYKEIDPGDAEKMREEFKRICDNYIGDTAPRQVNIPDFMVKDIRKIGPNDIRTDVFNAAWEENRKVMRTDQFPGFKNSPAAKAYAKKLTTPV
jgi:hypothetical protein